jgi:hypothetical protein
VKLLSLRLVILLLYAFCRRVFIFLKLSFCYILFASNSKGEASDFLVSSLLFWIGNDTILLVRLSC